MPLARHSAKQKMKGSASPRRLICLICCELSHGLYNQRAEAILTLCKQQAAAQPASKRLARTDRAKAPLPNSDRLAGVEAKFEAAQDGEEHHYEGNRFCACCAADN